MMTMALQAYAKRYLPQPAVDVLRLMKYRMELATFPRRVVDHRYGSHELKMTISDRVASEWYDRDWTLPPEIGFFSRGQIAKNGRIFDLGAHQCLIAMLLARDIVPDGQVVAVEANRHNAERARENVALNRVGNVEVVHAIVSRTSGQAHADFSFNSRVQSGLGARVGESIDGISIDDMSRWMGWPDLVYLDIEGFEIEALKGASLTLARWCHWFVELHGDETLGRYGARNADILQFFDMTKFARYLCMPDENSFRLVAENEPVPTERCFLIFSPRSTQLLDGSQDRDTAPR
ncbi:MAG TPA: FkbM family methyltransferase [Pseudolabrys sp.]|nr:FkbM family methyltransferase [Pseudolabrys sp.]